MAGCFETMFKKRLNALLLPSINSLLAKKIYIIVTVIVLKIILKKE